MALIAMGCQPKTKTKVVEVPKKDKVYDFAKTSYGDPVNVPVHDTACNSQRGLTLSNGIIAEAYMGVETLLVRTFIEEDVFENAKEKDIVRQTFEYQTINEGRRVYLCRDASTIPETTQEGAAISMKADADQAFALYETVRRKGTVALPLLKKVYLNAAQKEKEISRTVDKDEEANETTSYMTDNAVFMGGSNPTLISYPQSEVSRQYKLLGGIPLWTVDGVFQHEFGHFIFESVMNEDGIRFASYHDYVEKNPRLHTFHTPTASLARLTETQGLKAGFMDFIRSQDFFVGSLNEGFADMWSYYTMNQPSSMWDISCFAKNRSVASPVFYNGISKSWDDKLWAKTFAADFSPTPDDSSRDPIESCSQPEFSDIHIIGAAMAHTVDAVFTAALQGTAAPADTSLLKAEMSIAWLKSIKDSNEFDDLGGKASLSRILNTAVGTGMNYLKTTDKTAFCAVVNSKFPVLVKRWKDVKTDNEDVSGVVSFCSL
jgi:hypothetical protein